MRVPLPRSIIAIVCSLQRIPRPAPLSSPGCSAVTGNIGKLSMEMDDATHHIAQKKKKQKTKQAQEKPAEEVKKRNGRRLAAENLFIEVPSSTEILSSSPAPAPHPPVGGCLISYAQGVCCLPPRRRWRKECQGAGLERHSSSFSSSTANLLAPNWSNYCSCCRPSAVGALHRSQIDSVRIFLQHVAERASKIDLLPSEC